MKSLTFKAKMDELGISSSYSRPRVSDDNPFVESLFVRLSSRQTGRQGALKISTVVDIGLKPSCAGTTPNTSIANKITS
ncbi:hypothetical protein VB549_02580 [Vibrio parahaemolyticus]|uniref:hypothetical protein n=1 Tax=Vibrio parahaemolyticus TaxID=670 RepID=UPI001B82DC55|nr:hypothetical protein [Vibrio parahaemolyticus]ELC3206138.1 hypothetical protein [Vibrio parahaemolyticus]MCI9688735.1 hypothetical protein [Vibrio parahaemolyticus]MCR9697516.1 hypothetical protein [Vibrio parahaemolyticus]MCR9760809.1 hypothetical protein [Vibrio parahaemolyticus]MCR9813596.1 hypothetical protein [Vibrio parahaemolyticus]